MSVQDLLFYLVVFLSNVIQCVTGFAGTVLAMPFSVILVGYQAAKASLNVFGVLASVGVVATGFRKINVREFLKMTGIMLAGIIAAAFVPKGFFDGGSKAAYVILGVLVIALAVWNAVRFYTKTDKKPVPPAVAYTLLALAGVVHGIYVCGGPLLVSYASVKLKDKGEFRSTLSAVWIALNSVIFAQDLLINKYFTPQVTVYTCVGAAVLVAAIFLGNFLAKKLSREVFLQITYALMLISGVSLLLK